VIGGSGSGLPYQFALRRGLIQIVAGEARKGERTLGGKNTCKDKRHTQMLATQLDGRGGAAIDGAGPTSCEALEQLAERCGSVADADASTRQPGARAKDAVVAVDLPRLSYRPAPARSAPAKPRSPLAFTADGSTSRGRCSTRQRHQP